MTIITFDKWIEKLKEHNRPSTNNVIPGSCRSRTVVRSIKFLGNLFTVTKLIARNVDGNEVVVSSVDSISWASEFAPAAIIFSDKDTRLVDKEILFYYLRKRTDIDPIKKEK